MKKSIVSILILVFYISVGFSQNELNGYKYVIVPKKYDFLKGEPDKYQLNSLTKFLFAKYGFATLFEGEDYPGDLLGNPCLALSADVINNSSLFRTKIVIELKDCFSKVVFQTIEGDSREKDYKKAFQEAFRDASASLEVLDYKFNPELAINTRNNYKAEAEPSEKVEQKTVSKNTEVSTNPGPAPVPVAPVTPNKPEEVKEVEAISKSYKNENISFFLINQNDNIVAVISESLDSSYKKGEQIGVLKKTSRPDVYRITWKNKQGNYENTTGYFDSEGNLNVDIEINGEVQVIVFKVEK